MRDRPLLDDPREEWQTWLCGYRPVPAALDCDRDATWHGFVLDGPCERIVAMMACCDGHLPLMLAAADYAHPLRHPCGIPGSLFRWPENVCFTEWDETAEFATPVLAGVLERARRTP